MNPFKHMTLLLSLLGIASLSPATSFGGVIYESAPPSQTDIPFSDLLLNRVPGTAIGPRLTGVRFELLERTQVTRIGGHFIQSPISQTETIFGAVVALEHGTDFPDSTDLSTPDVLGSTSILLPSLSNNVAGSLSLDLKPGWYALVYGSGLFGTEGSGVALGGSSSEANSSYFIGALTIILGNPVDQADQPIQLDFWRTSPSSFSNQRFFVEGTAVPEPSSMTVLTFSVVLTMAFRRAWSNWPIAPPKQ